VPSDRVEVLLSRYGTRAVDVIEAITEGPDSALDSDPSYSTAEIRHLAQCESVVHLSDVILRRTNHAFTGDVSVELLEELATIVGEALAWSQSRMVTEVHEARTELFVDHGVQLPVAAHG